MVGRMKSTLGKDTFRLIRATRGRFLSLTAIVLLGMAFFIGVSSSSEFMSRSVDTYSDQEVLKDITVYSNYGFGSEDIEAIAALDDVAVAEGSKFADVIGTAEAPVGIIRIHSYDPDSRVNHFVLREGRLPKKENEVLAEGGTGIEPGVPIGTVVTLNRPDGKLGDYLSVNEVTVVGWIDTPLYLNMTKENSTLNNQYIQTYFYLPEESFVVEDDLVVDVLTKQGASFNSFEKPYEVYSKTVKRKIEDLGKNLATKRKEKIYREAMDAYEDGLQKYEQNASEFETEIGDAKQKLSEAYQKLVKGEQDLKDGVRKLKEAQKELEEQRVSGWAEIEKGREKLVAAQKELDRNRKLFEEEKEKYADLLIQLDDGIAKLEEARQGLLSFSLSAIPLKDLLRQSAGMSEAETTQLLSLLGLNENSTVGDLLAVLEGYEQAYDSFAEKTISTAVEELIQKAPADQQEQLKEVAEQLMQELAAIGIDPSQMSFKAIQEEIDAYAAQHPETARQIRGLINEILKKTGHAELPDSVQFATLSQLRNTLRNINDHPLDYVTVAQAAVMKPEIKELAGQLQVADNMFLSNLLSAVNAKLEELKKQRDQITDGLAEGEKKLKEGQRMIEEGYRQLEQGEKALTEGLLEGQKKIDQGWAEIEAGRHKLEAGWKEYYDGLKELEDNEADGREKLNQAKADLAKAYQDIQVLKNGEWTVLDRTMHYGSRTYHDTIYQMKAIASIFPVFFFLVAALVCLTTMTRLVDEQRGQIGIFRALGYTKLQCAGRFLTYASAASLIGGVLGTVIGLLTFPAILYNAWNMMYIQPPMEVFIPWKTVFPAFAGFLFVILYTTWTACSKDMKQVPSQLMRPKAPKLGKGTVLEKIKPVWNRISFTGKVTARNLIRYKKRLVMMVCGVAGCTALLIVGFGIKDSVNSMVQIQFDEIQKYDGFANTVDGLTGTEVRSLAKELKKDLGLEYVNTAASYSAKVYDPDKNRSETAFTQVFSDANVINELYQLRTRKYSHPVEVNDQGVVINEKLAENLGVGIGDFILLESDNGVLKEVRVIGINEMYVQHYVLMTSRAYQSVFGVDIKMDSIFIRAGTMSVTDVKNALGQNKQISEITFYNEIISNFTQMVNSLDLIVWVLILSSMMLSFVVLGNLMNINISERQREIATLKVLGFRRREVQKYIFKENNVLTVIGAFAGIPLGTALHHWIMRQVEMDYIMFGRSVRPVNYIISMILTVVFGWMVNMFMKKKLDCIEMVESLKSVE